MVGKKPNWYFKICWLVISPIFIFVCIHFPIKTIYNYILYIKILYIKLKGSEEKQLRLIKLKIGIWQNNDNNNFEQVLGKMHDFEANADHFSTSQAK